jgi:hypothetical protein
VEFEEALRRLGFADAQDRLRRGARVYAASPNRYLTYWVHAYDDGSALFTWEYAIAEYLRDRGIQLGDGEVLNLFMYPEQDEKGPQDGAWLVAATDRADAHIRSLDLASPDA